MRVRFGTLLKTDNVSFLIGAGASLDTGGVSLANIPIPLEGALIEKAAAEIEGDAAPGWLEFFYESVFLVSNNGYTIKERSQLFQSTQEKDIPAIAVNLEDYLSHLHMWLAGMVHETETLTLSDGTDIEITKDDLERLIKEITSSLTTLLDLPKTGKEDPLRSHRKFIKKILTRPLNSAQVLA